MKSILALVFLAVSQMAFADETLLMVRSAQSFPETMLALQTSLTEHGYVVSRVQRVDIGLTKSGFQTDKYRVVFFGKTAEQAAMVQNYPELIPFLPLNITVFAEQEETLAVSVDPLGFSHLSDDPQFVQQLTRWRSDILSMFAELREKSE